MPTKPPQHRPLFAPKPDQERGTAYERGYDRAWQKLRLAHLRANPLCVFCGRAATVVDHVIPIVIDASRRLDPSNLRSCDADCHAKLTTNFKLTGRNEMPEPQPGVARQNSAGHGGTGVGGVNL